MDLALVIFQHFYFVVMLFVHEMHMAVFEIDYLRAVCKYMITIR